MPEKPFSFDKKYVTGPLTDIRKEKETKPESILKGYDTGEHTDDKSKALPKKEDSTRVSTKLEVIQRKENLKEDSAGNKYDINPEDPRYEVLKPTRKVIKVRVIND